jgi:hypothetical protein
MISWGDVYKVAAAMVPLYMPLRAAAVGVSFYPVVEDLHVGAMRIRERPSGGGRS